jgi:hypothetical protein
MRYLSKKRWETAMPTNHEEILYEVTHLSKELGEAMDESTIWMDESLARDDFKEGVASLIERRTANFQKIEVSD